MMEKPYASADYYLNTYKGAATKEEVEPLLLDSSYLIDTLTYNRLNVYEPTEAQLSIIKMVCCQFADFKNENSDILESPLTGYSINGVSVTLGDKNIQDINGVIVPARAYALLTQTGLCCRILK